jgi:hypothetical protein
VTALRVFCSILFFCVCYFLFSGSKTLLGGLCLALTVFAFFLFATAFILTHLPASKLTRSRRILITVLYIDVLLLIIRSSYRVAEFANLEYQNPISTNETLFYVLDVLCMAVLNALWIPCHPSFLGMSGNGKQKSTSQSPASAAGTELMPPPV